MQSRSLKRLFALSALVSLAKADYYIDDQNFTSLVYSENPGGAKWGPFQEGGMTLSITLANGTMMTIDASQCYNYTYTYAACTVADDCQVQIPFSGSGITIYVLQAGAQGINASLTIDSGKPQYNVLPAPPGPNFYIPNVTLFNVQGITTGDHVATMTVQNWANIFSGMMFDYAFINQTIVSPTTTSSSSSMTSQTATSTASSPATTTASTSSKSAPNVGAIVGGVIGGLAVIAIAVAVFCFRRRRREERSSLNLDAEPKLEPFYSSQVSPFHGATLYSDGPHQTAESIVTPPPAPPSRSLEPSSNSNPIRPSKSQTAITNPSSSQVRSSSMRVSSPSRSGSHSAYSPNSSDTSRPSSSRIQQTHPMLTDDQADFVNSLYANNVPAAAIARVMERMMAGERRPAVEGYDSLPPPSYDHVTGRD